eukprot:m.133290 g.133290  ORF g.133290 m.133290 type:complete len:2144 (-) comp29666_c1_seq1:204-6635(-)
MSISPQLVAVTPEHNGKRAKLVFEDGTVYEGFHFGAEISVAGEAVFQTGMVGYPESLTDPSFTGQLLCLTYPMIGNYGVPDESVVDEHGLPKFFESDKIHPSALIVQDLCLEHSHWNAKISLPEYLKKHNVPGIYGVDTRAITKHLRTDGSMKAKLVLEGDDESAIEWYDPNAINLVAKVSTKTTKVYNPDGDVKIVAVDVGLKYNQLRCLIKRGACVTLVPWDHDFSTMEMDGLFLSNGPGDPVMADVTIKNLRKVLETQPERVIFGICLGHQLMSIANGGGTFKLPYGNRGHNQPCTHEHTRKCYITSQNHGFATDMEKLPAGWGPLFTNENDGSNEGIVHETNPWFSVQFHPEASAGPEDLECLFDVFLDHARKISTTAIKDTISAKLIDMEEPCLPTGTITPRPRKILVLGSGGLSIGQAGEFDYSGSQAMKALKEEGIQTVLINPNIATVQTMKGLADKVYFLPVTAAYVDNVIAEEKPDGILLSFGGQTALNCGIELEKLGILKKHNVKVLGTPVQAIEDTEDREIFSNKMAKIGEKCVPNAACSNTAEVMAAAAKIGYPIMMRSSFALGGLGSGVVENETNLLAMSNIAFANTTQVMIEPSLKGWKEVEYEVVRDAFDNTVTVCNMENFDPVGIHTGESIVVAPSQTLTNEEYNLLRNCAVKVVRHLGIVGECNIQYCLDPHSTRFYIIEVNARLSRSSALASKATGYPLAYVAAKLALNIPLPELRNSITKKTTACFEPSLDYCVVKVPRWDLAKFPGVDRRLGTAMKSVGEVMAIGRTFAEAFQKSIRMLDMGEHGFTAGRPCTDDDLQNPTDVRFLQLATALEEGYTVERLNELTKIDKWFLYHCQSITNQSKRLREFTLSTLPANVLLTSKLLGFSDRQIGDCVGGNEIAIRKFRTMNGIRPSVKQIDTVAAEYPAQTNYLYFTYHGNEDDVEFTGGMTMVLGSGVYRIGSSVEFDYCAVGCVRELRQLGHKTIMLNYNPETVSTDYDECDRLYFDQLTFETVMDVYEVERVKGVVLAMGGQIPNNISMELHRLKVNVFGTSPEMIDGAENRFKFSRMCDNNNIDQPEWKELTSVDDADLFCEKVTYPCLVRPSYVLSGVGMRVVYNRTDLEVVFKAAGVVSRDYPVVISKFILDAKEIEVDAVAKDGKIIIRAISEHVENAGIHSGDATIIHPPQDLTVKTIKGVEAISSKIAMALKITGPFNIQFIAKDDHLKVIECNVRVSRSFPFVSKTMGVDMIAIATRVMVGVPANIPDVIHRDRVIGVKVPQFSFPRLAGADPTLGVDMTSTGEVACFGKTTEEAYIKALQSTRFALPQKGSSVLISIGGFAGKAEFAPSVKLLAKMGYELYGSPGTADYYSTNDNIAITAVEWIQEEEAQNIMDLMAAKKFSLVINLPMRSTKRQKTNSNTTGAEARRAAIDFAVPFITDIKCAKLLINSIYKIGLEPTVSSIDCTFSRNTIRFPAFVASIVRLSSTPNKDMSLALAGGFGTLCVLSHPSKFSPIVENALCDVALIANHDDTTVTPKSPSRRTRSRSYSTSSDSSNNEHSVVPVAYATKLSKKELVDMTSVMEMAEALPNDGLLCVDGSDRQLATVLLFSHLYNKQLHVLNVRTTNEMKLIAASKRKGIAVSCSVSLTAMFDISRDGETETLWDYMDDIDILSINHNGDADGEVSELEVAVPLLIGAVERGLVSLKQLEFWLCDNPCSLFGIESESISENYIEVDLEYDHKLVNSELYQRCTASGRFGDSLLRGRVSRTVLHNKIAFVDGIVLAKPGAGDGITRSSTQAAHPLERLPSANSPATSVTKKALSGTEQLSMLTAMPKLNAVQDQFKGASILSVKQFSRDMLKVLYDYAHQMKVSPNNDLMKGIVLASIFYEASTRTSCSFSAAILRLGGSVIPLNQIANTSVSKGETLGDFMRTMECYADVIVLRHPESGSVKQAASVCSKPLINAGNGTGEHPTQALLDVFTIREELGTVNGLNITMVGDLKHGRTVHSLARLLALYKVNIRYVAPKGLEMPQNIIDECEGMGIKQSVHTDIKDVIADTDVLYVTRLQRERFASEEEADKMADYTVDPKLLRLAKKKMIIMHPLPRVNEIHTSVDTDSRAAYFRQMEYGMYVRMALLALICGKQL